MSRANKDADRTKSLEISQSIAKKDTFQKSNDIFFTEKIGNNIGVVVGTIIFLGNAKL